MVEPASATCAEEVQLSAAKALFDVVDSDGSGELSRDEVHGSRLACGRERGAPHRACVYAAARMRSHTFSARTPLAPRRVASPPCRFAPGRPSPVGARR